MFALRAHCGRRSAFQVISVNYYPADFGAFPQVFAPIPGSIDARRGFSVIWALAKGFQHPIPSGLESEPGVRKSLPLSASG